jgi:hypothetical protein
MAAYAQFLNANVGTISRRYNPILTQPRRSAARLFYGSHCGALKYGAHGSGFQEGEGATNPFLLFLAPGQSRKNYPRFLRAPDALPCSLVGLVPRTVTVCRPR